MLNLGASLLAALYVLLFSTPSWAKIDNCEGLLGSTPITNEALTALQDAREHFEFRLLSKTIAGRPRLVILAGETHVKSQEASGVGLELLNHFALRGLEGANVKDNLAAKILGVYLTVINSFSIRALGRAGSTIHDARDVQATSGAKSVNVHLEKGHRSSLREKLSMTQLILALSSPVLVFAGDFLGKGSAMDLAISAFVLTHAGYAIAQIALAEKYSERPWFSRLFPLHNGLLDERNETMVTQIEKALIDHPEYDHMLVLVGSAHVHGLEKLLIERYGFSQVDFPMQ